MSTTEKIVTQCGTLSIGAIVAATANSTSGLITGATALAAILGIGAGLRDKHGPQCARVTKRIRTRILNDYAQFTEDDDGLHRAAALLEHDLRGCFLDIETLAKSAVTEPGFATSARDAVLTALAFTDRERRDETLAFRILRDAIDEGLRAGLASPEFMALLQPHVVLEIASGIAHLQTSIDTLGARLDNLDAQTRDTLDLIAMKFGDAEPETRSLPDLKSFLIDKSRDLKALEAELAGLKGRSARIDNIRGAAEAALEALDIEEAERLLADARDIQIELLREPLETNATLMEIQARAALIRGDAQAAFTLLSAAADSFAVIDPIEPARRRLHAYVKILVAHAESYGGDSLWHAKVMTIAAIESFGKETAPGLWADGKTWLGSILQTKGVHTQGDAGDVLLSRAVAAFREALTVYTLEDHRTGWAMVQHNLANTLYYKARSAARTDAPGLLEEAVTAFQSVLMVHSPTFGPFQWASAKNSLGVAMIEQSVHADRSDALLLCDAAITAFSDALTVRTKDQYPVYWAATVNNLATAHREKGARTKGREGLELLERSLADCHTALSVRKFDQAPLPWADTMQGLAKTEICIARHEATENPRPHLLAAIAHLERAMTVFDASDMQQVLGNAAQLRDELKAQLDAP